MHKEDGRHGLFEVGFTEKQVEHLSKIRKNYVEKEESRIAEEQHRLEFARWLVRNGRLTERVA